MTSKSTNLKEAVTILDGGIGRELLRMRAPFQQPEWSALALMEEPELVKKAHLNFARAGSDILTTNSYAVVPYHIGDTAFREKGTFLSELAGKLASEAAHQYGCKVAGSLPPLFGSYHPELFVAEKAQSLLNILIPALSPYTDIWLAETLSRIDEAKAVLTALKDDHRPVWLSFTLEDEKSRPDLPPRLRSGETVSEAVSYALSHGAAALLFNCSQPEVMEAAVLAGMKEIEIQNKRLPIGVYANGFPAQPKGTQANITLQPIRKDLSPDDYAPFAQRWKELGVSIIGGCCGIGPEHIKKLKASL